MDGEGQAELSEYYGVVVLKTWRVALDVSLERKLPWGGSFTWADGELERRPCAISPRRRPMGVSI